MPIARRLLLLALGLTAVVPAAADGEMFDPRFREGAPSDSLVEGPPRFSRGHVNAFIDLFEAAFDLALTAESEQTLRDAIENEFVAASPARRESFLALVEPIVVIRTKARRGEVAAVRALLRRFRAAIDERIRKQPATPAHRILTRALERRHRVLWVGEPAIKGVAVDAYIELVQFMVGLARNERVALSPGRRTALIDYLGGDLSGLDRETRERLAGVHRTWLRVKGRWDHAKDARRFLARWAAVRLGARLAPGGKLIVEPGPDLAAYAREAAKVAAADDRYDAATVFARNPVALLEAASKGLGLSGEGPAFTFMYR
jgi:hypothetical protein